MKVYVTSTRSYDAPHQVNVEIVEQPNIDSLVTHSYDPGKIYDVNIFH